MDFYNQIDSYKPNVSYFENIVRISQFLCYSFPGGITILVPPVVSEIGNQDVHVWRSKTKFLRIILKFVSIS